MKKIIDGKVYNTETATEIGRDTNVGIVSTRDFTWYEATLYRTKKGAYFIVGSGGPMSQFAEPYGQNGSQSGCNVFIVLDESEALAWAENHDVPTDVIEREFGDIVTEA